MNIEIDSKSGFCFGVVYAIQIVEDFLEQNKALYCLGDIVHNNVEVERLKKKGLITIDHEKFNQLKDCTVLIRAHGEPPETYKIALKNINEQKQILETELDKWQQNEKQRDDITVVGIKF